MKTDSEPKNTHYVCEKCGGELWQGPYYRGAIVDLELEVSETVYACVNCHNVASVEYMQKLVELEE